MSKAKNPIGFMWSSQATTKDPNCIVLTSATSHRLGKFFGTFEDREFCLNLEGFIDGQASQIQSLQEKNEALKEELEQSKERKSLGHA